MREALFSVGLQGLRGEDVEMVKEVIERTLKEASENDIDMDRVDAFCHQVELEQKHVKGKKRLVNCIAYSPLRHLFMVCSWSRWSNIAQGTLA